LSGKFPGGRIKIAGTAPDPSDSHAVARSTSEVELKLGVAPDAVRKLTTHPLLRGGTRPQRKRLHSVYFDTPALDLWRRGVALRVRREGRRWVQTVKGEGTVQAGLYRRAELEWEVSGPQPDFTRLGRSGGNGDFTGIFASAQLRAQLRPVFVTDFSRSRRLLELGPEATVEVAIDVGEIRSGGRQEKVSEIELELKRGAASHLYELALKLLKDVPLAVENRSKAERGFALARGERSAPVKARPATLSTEMSVNDAFKEVIWASLAHLQANERGMLEGADPEYLHQMRVALRRLRSAFSVFAPLFPEEAIVPLAAELRWLAASLGPARDWDVFVTETLPPVHAEFGEHAALTAFGQQCAGLRRSAGRKAHRAAASQRYHQLVLTLASWLTAERWPAQMDDAGRARLAAPVRDFASAVLEERYGRVRKRGRSLERLSPAELHRLRIAIKKFRYATDFFAGLYDGKRARETLKRLARLQDILGAINDAATVGSLVGEVLQHGKTSRRYAAEARGILLGWSRGQAATLRRELKTAWKPFRAAEKFW
jgi:triphosphatase